AKGSSIARATFQQRGSQVGQLRGVTICLVFTCHRPIDVLFRKAHQLTQHTSLIFWRREARGVETKRSDESLTVAVLLVVAKKRRQGLHLAWIFCQSGLVRRDCFVALFRCILDDFRATQTAPEAE